MVGRQLTGGYLWYTPLPQEQRALPVSIRGDLSAGRTHPVSAEPQLPISRPSQRYGSHGIREVELESSDEARFECQDFRHRFLHEGTAARKSPELFLHPFEVPPYLPQPLLALPRLCVQFHLLLQKLPDVDQHVRKQSPNFRVLPPERSLAEERFALS